MLAAIDVRPEFDPFIINLTQPGKAEYLETAAISEDSPFPIHKSMQPAGLADNFHTRPKIKMIRIGKNHPDACFPEVFRSN